MKKNEVIKRINDESIIAVVRADNKDLAIRMIDAIIKGGIKIIEVTMTVPNAVDIIKELSSNYKGSDVIIGAGTVLDAETARSVILAGAELVLSPCLSLDVIKLCNRYAVCVIPGVMTVTETVSALEAGAEIVKIFPANAFSPSIIKAFKGPLPQVSIMPTGGVSYENAGEWIKAGAVAVGTGSNLTEGAKTGEYDKITDYAKKLVEAVNEAKNK